MNPEILNIIIALCVGAAPSPQECHKQRITCLDAAMKRETKRELQCEALRPNLEKVSKCREDGGGKIKNIYENIAECASK